MLAVPLRMRYSTFVVTVVKDHLRCELHVTIVLRYTDPKFSAYGAQEYKPLSMDRSVC